MEAGLSLGPGLRAPHLPPHRRPPGRHHRPRRRRLDAGKVLGLVRIDAPEGGKGKPCGASHIPKDYKCGRTETGGSHKQVVAPTIAAGLSISAVIALGVVLNKKGINSRQPAKPRSAKEQEAALRRYTMSSMSMNTKLRDGKPLNEEELAVRDGIDQWLKGQKPVEGVYMRGINQSNNEFAKARVGDVVESKAFTSVTTDKNVAMYFASTQFGAGIHRDRATIVVARGAAYKLADQTQKESLLPRGTQYRITKIRDLDLDYDEDLYSNFRRRRAGLGKSRGKYRVVYVDILSAVTK